MGRATEGILLINKEEGEISHDVVKRIRSILPGTKVGHAGTLDPFATGLLIVLLGQGTKLSPYLLSEKKRYKATVRLGVETDTLDPTGEVVGTCGVPLLRRQDVEDQVRGFLGEIEQVPPRFSAVRVSGTRAYRLARKGERFELPKRRVWVYAVDVLDVALPEITLDILCSSGTYIRSLAADFAGSLGSCGHLKALTRTEIGPFKVGRALSSSALFRGRDHALIEGAAIPLRAALPDMVEIAVSNGLGKKIVHGYQPSIEEVSMGEDTWNDVRGPVKVVLHDRLIAIGHIQDASGPYMARFRIERVFQGLSN